MTGGSVRKKPGEVTAEGWASLLRGARGRMTFPGEGGLGGWVGAVEPASAQREGSQGRSYLSKRVHPSDAAHGSVLATQRAHPRPPSAREMSALRPGSLWSSRMEGHQLPEAPQMGAGGSPSPSGCSEQGLRPAGELTVAQPQRRGASSWREVDLTPAPLVRSPFIVMYLVFSQNNWFSLNIC